MKFILLLSTFILSTVASAKTFKDTVKADLQILRGYQAFSASQESPTEVVLNLSERDFLTETTMTSKQGSETRRESDATTPDGTQGEYSRLTIKKLSDTQVLLISETAELAVVEQTGDTFWVRLRTEAKANLVDSNWEDLIARRQVKIVVPKSEQKKVDAKVKDYFESLLREQSLLALQNQFPHLEIQVAVKVTSYKLQEEPLQGTIGSLIGQTKGTLSLRMTITAKE